MALQVGETVVITENRAVPDDELGATVEALLERLKALSGAAIVKDKYLGGTVYFCAECQKP